MLGFGSGWKGWFLRAAFCAFSFAALALIDFL